MNLLFSAPDYAVMCAGGHLGLHKRRWQAHEVEGDTFTGVHLTYESPTGEEVRALMSCREDHPHAR